MSTPADYDYLQGITRVAKAAENPDGTWIEILVCHAVLKVEINAVLESTLPLGTRITSGPPTFSFGHKIAVLEATWTAEADRRDKICRVLLRFNELRNQIAHPNKHEFKARRRALLATYRVMTPDCEPNPSFTAIAQDVCTALAGGPTVQQLHQMFNGLESLVAAMADLSTVARAPADS